MVFVSIGKKKRNLIICVLLVIVSVALFSGCDPQAGKYPYLKEQTWTCSNPCFTIVYAKQEDGSIASDAMLEWEGNLIEVDIWYRSTLYDVYLKNSLRYEDVLFGGTWKYEDGNLIFNINKEEDFIFGNQYSKLIFSPS